MNNVIWIEPLPGTETAGAQHSGQITFPAPNNNAAARALWVFLVENIRPGFVVELSSFGGAAELTRLSGAPVPPELYARVMGE